MQFDQRKKALESILHFWRLLRHGDAFESNLLHKNKLLFKIMNTLRRSPSISKKRDKLKSYLNLFETLNLDSQYFNDMRELLMMMTCNALPNAISVRMEMKRRCDGKNFNVSHPLDLYAAMGDART